MTTDNFELKQRARAKQKREYMKGYKQDMNAKLAKMRDKRRSHEAQVAQDFHDRITTELRRVTVRHGGTEVTQMVMVQLIPPCGAENARPRVQTAFVGCRTGRVSHAVNLT